MRSTPAGGPAGSLRRTLGDADVAALTLSALSPAVSIFITGAAVLHMAGTGAAGALMLGGVVAVLGSLVFAELAAAFPNAGGVYPGISGVLGETAGFVTITLGMVAAPATLAFASLGFADYARVLEPGLPKLPLAISALSAAALLAILNVRLNARITAVFLIAELFAVLILTVAAALHPARALSEVLLRPVMLGAGGALVATPPWTLALATVAGAFACAGSSLAIYFAEELRGPPERIGGIVAAIGVLAAVVVGVPLVLLTTSIPSLAQSLSAEAPIAAYLRAVVGPSIAYAVTLLVALAIFNVIVANTLAFSRFVYATGRDGAWPTPIAGALARLHGRFSSPWAASLALGAAGAALCFVGERRLLVVLSGDVFTMTLVVTSVLIGRRRGQTGVAMFRTPLFPLVPLLGFLIIAAFCAADWRDPQAGRPSLILLATIAAGAFLCHRRLRRRRIRVPA